jgi:hypothetical protein
MIQIYVMTYTSSNSELLKFGIKGYKKSSSIIIFNYLIEDFSDTQKDYLSKLFSEADDIAEDYERWYIFIPECAGKNVKDWFRSWFKNHNKSFNENIAIAPENIPKSHGNIAEAAAEVLRTTSEITKFEEPSMSEIMTELQDALNAIAGDDNGIDGCFVYTPQQQPYMSEVAGAGGAVFTPDNISNWVGIFTSKLFRDKLQFINEGIGKLHKVIFYSEKMYILLYFAKDDVIVGFLSSLEQMDEFSRANTQSEKALYGDNRDGSSKYRLLKAKEDVRCLKQILSDAGIL